MALRNASYNCRGIKSVATAVNSLCDNHDIILVQEHWLSKSEPPSTVQDQ